MPFPDPASHEPFLLTPDPLTTSEAVKPAMFANFVPPQLECLRKYTTALPSALDVLNGLEEEATLSEAKIARRMAHMRKILEQSGVHYVIDLLVELPAVLNDISARLARGEKP